MKKYKKFIDFLSYYYKIKISLTSLIFPKGRDILVNWKEKNFEHR